VTEDLELVAFLRREHPRLVGALSLMTGDAWLAEELAQEALVRACAHWERVEAMEAPGAWVHAVGLNLARSRWRRQRVERRALRKLDSRAVTESPETSTALAIREAVAALPLKQREAVVLRFFLGHSATDAARLLGTSAGAVRQRTYMALRALRLQLEPDHEEV
jgi:RNA polymerase sigma factor (sigma-70 family)